MTGPPQSAPERAADASSPIQALLGRGSIYAIAVGIQASAGVVVLPLLTRLLDPAELGVVSLGLVVQFTVALVAGLGLPAAVLRAFYKEEGLVTARRIVAWTGLAAAAVVAAALISLPLWAEAIAAEGQEPTLRIALLAAAALAILGSSQSLLRAQNRAGLFVATVVISTIGAQLLGLGAIAVLDGGSEAYFGGLAVGALAGAGLGAAAVGTRPTDLQSRSGVGTALRIGLPTVPHSLGIYVLAAGDRAVIAQIDGLAAVGQYQVAYVIGALALTLLSAANNAWTPIVFAQSDERRWQTLADTAAVLWRLLPFAVGVLAIGAPLLLALAAPASYDPDDLSSVTAIVSFAAVPQLVYSGMFMPLYWSGRMSALGWITPIAAAANVGLNIALLPVLGLEGAALATVLAYATMAGLVWRRARALADVPWPATTMLGSALICLALASAGALAPLDGWWLAIRVLVSGALLVAAAITVRDALRRDGALAA